MWMSRKVVKIIAWILVIALLMSVIVMMTSVFAADETMVAEQGQDVMNFSLEEAIAYAKEHNYDLLISKIDKEDIDLSKKITEDLQDTLKDTYSLTKGTGDTFDTYKIRNGYALEATKNAVKMLEKANDFKDKSTEVAVLSAYYALSEKTRLLDIKKSTVDLINNQVKVCESKLALGNVSDLVYKTVLLKKSGAEIDLINAQADYEKALMGFNKVLALPLDQNVNLTSNVVFEKHILSDYDTKFEERKAEDLTYAQLLIDKGLIEKERNMGQAYYGIRAPEYKQIANKVEKNELNIKKQEVEIEYKLKSDIKKIDVLENSIATSEAQVALTKIIFEITKLKNSLGMSTDLDVISSELDVQDAEMKYTQAVHGYNTVILMFEKNIVS